MAAMYVVILAGGGGTRLRPLSTAARPKPFLPLLATGETLLQRTVARLRGPELGIAGSDVRVVTAAAYRALVREQLPGIAVLEEPEGRNTAAAVALAALALERDEGEVMVVLPADHRIDPAREADFRSVLRAAAGLAGGCLGIGSPLVTLGIGVTRPATEYGYLRPITARREEIGGLEALPLAGFEEKPSPARALELAAMPGVAWNAGMFAWRRGAILAALERHAGDVLDGVRRGLASDLAAAYAGLPSRSIDYAVMEPAAAAGSVVMAPMGVGWTDVGTWPALLDVLGVPGVEGGVIEAGATAATEAGDLVVERGAGGLAVRVTGAGALTPAAPVALLRGAAHARDAVGALLDRCAAAERSG